MFSAAATIEIGQLGDPGDSTLNTLRAALESGDYFHMGMVSDRCVSKVLAFRRASV